LHGKKDIFIEDNDNNVKEDEANRFASDTLIPNQQFKVFLSSTRLSKEAIGRFVAEIGIAPGIVVGRLQHDGHLLPSHCNDLKTRLGWKK